MVIALLLIILGITPFVLCSKKESQDNIQYIGKFISVEIKPSWDLDLAIITTDTGIISTYRYRCPVYMAIGDSLFIRNKDSNNYRIIIRKEQ